MAQQLFVHARQINLQRNARIGYGLQKILFSQHGSGNKI